MEEYVDWASLLHLNITVLGPADPSGQTLAQEKLLIVNTKELAGKLCPAMDEKVWHTGYRIAYP